MASTTVQTYDFTVHQGSDLNVRLCLTALNGSPSLLSGYNVRGSVKHRYGDTGKLLDLDPTIVSGYCPGEYCGRVPDPVISGLIDVQLTASQTSVLPVGQMVYDIEKHPASNPEGVSKVIKGYFNVLPEVTT